MTTTTNIKLSTPAHGSNVDTWDADPVNNNSGIIDNAFGSVTSKGLTNSNVTLSATEAQASVLRFSGVLTGDVIINVSAIIKSWYIDNLTTGAFLVTISGGSGNVVCVPQGETTQVYWDGTNCKFINLGRVGEYFDYAGASVPNWVTGCTVPPYLSCDGTTFSAGTYPYLNTILGTTTLPDLRGRARFTLNGGTGRITTAASGIDGNTRFSSGGTDSATIAQVNLPNITLATSIASGQGSHAHTEQVTNLSGAEPVVIQGVANGSGNKPSSNTTVAATLPAMTGTTPLGGSGTVLAIMPPAQISGITMIRAA